MRTTTTATTVSLLEVVITKDLFLVGALAYFTTLYEPGFKFAHGSDHYRLSSRYRSRALAHFTTPYEPGFMVTCNLHFVYGLHPFEKVKLF